MSDTRKKPAATNDDYDISSLLIHADTLDDKQIPVGVPISTSTTFRHPKPEDEQEGELHPAAPQGFSEGDPPPFDPQNPDRHIYSRYSQPVLTRTEKVLSALLKGNALAFSSGLSAIFAVLLLYQPEVIAIGEGYHGSHETIAVYRKTRDNVQIIDLDADYSQYKGKKLLCWLETPVNPKGICRDIEKYVKKTRAAGGKIAIDSTFAPPPLQEPFEFGVDIAMHSATKYFAGHSDALVGVLATPSKEEWMRLWEIRTYTGMTPGSLESWLLLRSLRSLPLRVQRQSSTATALAVWLNQVATEAPNKGDTFDNCPGGVLKQVWHPALQGMDGTTGDGFNPLGGSATGDEKHRKKPQMTGGPACFSILTSELRQAKYLPHLLKLMVPATSLGGVESLIEHRVLSDKTADPCLLRLSIGLEDVEDIKEDFRRAIRAVLDQKSKSQSKL